VNVQRGEPSITPRIPARLVRDVVVVLPSVDSESVELVAAQASGFTLIQRSWRDGRALAVAVQKLWMFFGADEAVEDLAFTDQPALAPIVFSWLAGRGAYATRIEIGDLASADDLQFRLSVALASPQLFSERLILRNSARSRT
jgi:hypothetical protein